MTALIPGGTEIPSVVRGSAANGYDVEFMTRETGLCITICYSDDAFGQYLCLLDSFILYCFCVEFAIHTVSFATGEIVEWQ